VAQKNLSAAQPLRPGFPPFLARRLIFETEVQKDFGKIALCGGLIGPLQATPILLEGRFPRLRAPFTKSSKSQKPRRLKPPG
jgi:hypothetical protein